MSYSTILVYVGGDLLGDALIKLPFIAALRHNNPEAKITWCTGEFSSVFSGVLAPLVEGELDEVTTLKLKLKLKYHKFFSPSLGYFFSDFKPLEKAQKSRRLIDKMLGFLRVMGMTKMPDYKLVLDQEWQEKATKILPEGKSYIGFAVGAGYRSKCWPQDS